MSNLSAIPSSIDAVIATSLADYSKTITDNVYNDNVLLKKFSSRKRLVNGGATVVYPVITSDQNAGGFYLGYGQLNTQQPDAENLVEYKWQNVYEPISISRDEERQNSGDMHKIVDLMGTKIQRSELSISKRVEQALSTPTAGAGNLVDLETLVNTGTLGSVNGSTATYWQATVTASGSFAAQGSTDMNTAYYAVAASAENDVSDLILTNKTIFQYYEDVASANDRGSRNDVNVNIGHPQLSFKVSTPVVYGNFIGSGLMFGLNTNYIDLVVDTETDFVTTDFLRPVNQTAKVAFILFRSCGLVTNNRRRNWKLTGITA